MSRDEISYDSGRMLFENRRRSEPVDLPGISRRRTSCFMLEPIARPQVRRH